MDSSDRALKRWYAKYNALYFNGELTTKVTIYWKPLSADMASACPVYETADDIFEIILDPKYSGDPKIWKELLLHEMVHVKLWKKSPRHMHGISFQKEMLRLATIGAFKGIW